MTEVPVDAAPGERPLRLWPGMAIVALMFVLRFAVPALLRDNKYAYIGAIATLLLGLVFVLWWLFLSRAPWRERLVGVGLIAVALALTPRILHDSIALGGMGVMFYVFVLPGLCVAFLAWAVFSRRLSGAVRWAAMIGAIVLACGFWALLRTDGSSSWGSELTWRWTATSEELLLAGSGEARASSGGTRPAIDSEPEWPGFRGARRDGVVRGVRIATDWSAEPPVELWRRPVGPGWSSFAVHGDVLFTQEQRGEEEMVSCYDAATGEPLWRHADPVRFWETQGGAGPRGTPTLHRGRVYTLGATGVLNALDAADGRVVWSRDAGADAEVEVPFWGFSGSPLVSGDLLLVPLSGRLAAYELATGEPRWTSEDGGVGYSSPHPAAIDGVEQVVFLSGAHVRGVVPADGSVLWEHDWSGYPIVQPAFTADGDLLLSAQETFGVRRLGARRGPDGWKVEERWTSIRLKPYFNDFVVHQGHAYGFDGTILAAMELENGERTWKGGRYGNGQLVLLPDQDLLLAITERGELALVSATPERFVELARVPALEGKTWNHPVVVGDRLFVRNSREMAAFRLRSAG